MVLFNGHEMMLEVLKRLNVQTMQTRPGLQYGDTVLPRSPGLNPGMGRMGR